MANQETHYEPVRQKFRFVWIANQTMGEFVFEAVDYPHACYALGRHHARLFKKGFPADFRINLSTPEVVKFRFARVWLDQRSAEEGSVSDSCQTLPGKALGTNALQELAVCSLAFLRLMQFFQEPISILDRHERVVWKLAFQMINDSPECENFRTAAARVAALYPEVAGLETQQLESEVGAITETQ